MSQDAGLEPSGSGDFGVYWDVGLQPDGPQLGFIIDQGDEKDPGPDMFLDLAEAREAWIVSGDPAI